MTNRIILSLLIAGGTALAMEKSPGTLRRTRSATQIPKQKEWPKHSASIEQIVARQYRNSQIPDLLRDALNTPDTRDIDGIVEQYIKNNPTIVHEQTIEEFRNFAQKIVDERTTISKKHLDPLKVIYVTARYGISKLQELMQTTSEESLKIFESEYLYLTKFISDFRDGEHLPTAHSLVLNHARAKSNTLHSKHSEWHIWVASILKVDGEITPLPNQYIQLLHKDSRKFSESFKQANLSTCKKRIETISRVDAPRNLGDSGVLNVQYKDKTTAVYIDPKEGQKALVAELKKTLQRNNEHSDKK